jgi:hypothetical protein
MKGAPCIPNCCVSLSSTTQMCGVPRMKVRPTNTWPLFPVRPLSGSRGLCTEPRTNQDPPCRTFRHRGLSRGKPPRWCVGPENDLNGSQTQRGIKSIITSSSHFVSYQFQKIGGEGERRMSFALGCISQTRKEKRSERLPGGLTQRTLSAAPQGWALEDLPSLSWPRSLRHGPSSCRCSWA